MNGCYGALQILFVIQMSLSFMAFVTVVLHKDEVDNKHSITNKFLIAAWAGDISVVPTCLLVFFIILKKAHSEDRVGNFYIARPSASFYFAFVSWILDSFVASLLRLIGVCYCKENSGPAPWQLTLVGNLLFITQQCVQIYCIYQLEIKARKICEGAEWSTIRKGMYVLLVFFNTYNWMVNLSAVGSIAEVKQKCMEDLLTPAVSHIVHTVGRAAFLAYRIECAHLFYKYYEKDKSSLEPVEGESGYVPPNLLGHSETEKGRWFGGLLASLYCGAAVTSYVLYNKKESDKMILGTGAVLITTITVFVTCSVLLHSGSRNISVPYDGKNPLENIAAYISGSSLRHMRLLLFYSITAVTYHFAFALHLSMQVNNYDELRMIREGFKGITCIFMAVFATWGYHKDRKLRSWCALHVMLWMILTSLFLDLAEECKSYVSDNEDNLVLYGFPLAIDFKMFVLIHALSDVTSAKKKFLLELQRNYDNPENVISGGNTELQETNPLSDSASVLSYGTNSISL